MLSCLRLSWDQFLPCHFAWCHVLYKNTMHSHPLWSPGSMFGFGALSRSEKQTHVSPNLSFLESSDVNISNKYRQSFSPKQHTYFMKLQEMSACSPSTQGAEVGCVRLRAF